MSIPEVFFRETIDLNRYSNAVATNFQTTYNDIILVAAKKLKQLSTGEVLGDDFDVEEEIEGTQQGGLTEVEPPEEPDEEPEEEEEGEE